MKESNFSEHIFGGRGRELEGPDRTERNEKPGRGLSPKASRGGSRSDESESRSVSARKNRAEKQSIPRETPEADHDQMMTRSVSYGERVAPVEPIQNAPGESDAVNPTEGRSSEPNEFAWDSNSGSDVSGRFEETDGTTHEGWMTQAPVDEQVRHRAMTTFVEQMQNELGVPPEKVVQAFAELDQATLMGPPDEAVGQFIEKLQLPVERQPRAAVLYKDMVHGTGDMALSEELVGEGVRVNFDVASQRDVSLRRLDKSLDEMNSNFFMDKSAATPVKPHVPQESLDAQISRMMMARSHQSPNEDELDGSGAEIGLTALAAGDGEGAVTSGGGVAGASESELNWSDSDLLSMNGSGQEASDRNAFAGDDSSQGGSQRNGSDFLSENRGIQSGSSKTMSQADSDVTHESASSKDSVSSSEGGSMAVAPGVSSASQPSTAAAGLGPSAMMMNRQPTSQDEAENVRELIKQAQIILKRGGGEMKLEMKPEGMGQVHLRVSVENGQVNVQMMTENDAAKKALEKGLGELKSTLAAQQLKVESLRVDVGNDIQKQLDQNNQDQAREQARHFAQDFMEQFRDERQGFRQGILENNGWRSYGRSQTRRSVEPEPVVTASGGRQVSDGSKRLNLVA